MKKLKVLAATIMLTGVMAAVPQNVFAKVDTYIIKDATNGRLYQYDVEDIIPNSNNRLLFEFISNSKKDGIYMVHDNQTEKYINYKNVKTAIEDKNNTFDLDQLYKTVQSEKVPFYVYNKVFRDGQIKNEVNFTGNNIEIDFGILQLRETGNVHISGSNSKFSNLDFKWDLILAPKKDGEIILKNIQAKNIKIISGKSNQISLIDVKAEEVEIGSNVKVHISGDTVIKSIIVKEGTEIQTKGSPTIGNLRIDTKDQEAQVKLDGNFAQVQVDKVCNLELSTATKVERLNAVSDVILKGDSAVRIGTITGIKNIKNIKDIKSTNVSTVVAKKTKKTRKTGTTIPANRYDENKPSTGGGNKPTDEVIVVKPSTDEVIVVKPPTDEIIVVKPELELGVVDIDKSCILNIHYVNYGIIVLQQGNYKDYNFYVDGEKVQVQAVNKEGSIVKIELKDRNTKKITVEKGDVKEEITLKYDAIKF